MQGRGLRTNAPCASRGGAGITEKQLLRAPGARTVAVADELNVSPAGPDRTTPRGGRGPARQAPIANCWEPERRRELDRTAHEHWMDANHWWIHAIMSTSFGVCYKPLQHNCLLGLIIAVRAVLNLSAGPIVNEYTAGMYCSS